VYALDRCTAAMLFDLETPRHKVAAKRQFLRVSQRFKATWYTY
jgi:hypothetical protein